MKIYTADNKEAESDVEILLNHQELKKLINRLTNFENEIEQFQTQNSNKDNMGFTHLHLKDCGLFTENSNSDIVLYVDLNDK